MDWFFNHQIQKKLNSSVHVADAAAGCSIQKLIPKPLDFWASNFYVEVDINSCNGCGTCETRCQVGAVHVQTKNQVTLVNLNRCIGCGLCVSTCPGKAIALKKKSVETMLFHSQIQYNGKIGPIRNPQSPLSSPSGYVVLLLIMKPPSQASDADNLDRLSGIVERITYHNVENGWSVLKVSPFNDPNKLVCVIIHQAKVFAGSTMDFYGNWTHHPKHGEQFKAEKAIEKKPSTSAALEKYLGSGLIKNVGPKTAQNSQIF